MRCAAIFVCCLFAFPAVAEDQGADVQPLPEVPPPPAMADDASLEPQVTITRRGADKVEEYRVNGRLYMLKVTPPDGPPYYLVDDTGDGVWSRRDSLDSGLRVPRWVIHRF